VSAPGSVAALPWGELAAVGTAACWAVSAVAFEAAGRRIGAMVVNVLRLALALVILAAYGAVVHGRAWPTDASGEAWLWLGLSGIAGFTFGDLCLFRAFVLIGARLSALLMATAPLFTVVLGWLWLGERLELPQVVGVACTVSGVLLAIADRRRPTAAGGHADPRERGAWGGARIPAAGVLLGLAGALGQALGLVLSKRGMGDYDPVAATQIRVCAGLLGFVVITTVIGWWGRVAAGLRDRQAIGATATGTLFGPVLGVALSLTAVQLTAAGVAASLMALTPVIVIPIAVLVGRERIAVAGLLGTGLAVLGAVLLVL
jgi:drug/metabolite transporter (DMT)-like permease